MRTRATPADRLARALLFIAEGATIEEHTQRSWGSVLFTGDMHSVKLWFPSQAAADRFALWLPDQQFEIPGHLCADAQVVEIDGLVARVEVLLLEDA